MKTLTTKELKIFDNLSMVQSRSVRLGQKIQTIINAINGGLPITQGTPVNAAASGAVLDISGVVVHGETVVINNPFVNGVDSYEFLATASQLPSVSTNIPIDIETHTTKASGSLTIDMQPASGDTMTIGEKTYIFVPVGTNNADGEVSIGEDLLTAQAAIIAAINGTDGVNIPHPLVSAADFILDACVITAKVGGVSGNTIVTTEDFTAMTNTFSAATLLTGADCSAANAVTALVQAIAEYDSQLVSAVDGVGDTVTLTAIVPGTAGNYIEIEETMVNGAFVGAVTQFAGGIDGTIADAYSIMIDETYLYIAIDANGINDGNWRRMELGNAY